MAYKMAAASLKHYTFYSGTHLEARPVDGFSRLIGPTSNDADSRMDVPFGGFVDIVLHFGGKIPPPKPQLGGE